MVYKTPEQKDNFKALLDESYSWPDYYRFKFIVRKENRQELLDLFSEHKVEEKPSNKGNYISCTIRILVQSSDEVLKIYESASTIKGIISL